jgi:peptidoglycan/LPS O-acetylase OafA/YrhL
MLRPDIQALRGLAVLVVLLFHARLGFFQGGYLGVDIFFVISGFLITSMIRTQLKRDSFSFKEFYFRRAKRLLPAAYTTLVVSTVASVFLLTATEFRQFADQVAGAVTFTANLVLRGQGNYFGGEADLKPLLQTWSLSIEEQYYLVMPALLFFTKPRWWPGLITLIILVSLAMCLALGFYRPDFAFYLFPTRAWELGIGSIGAFLFGAQRTTAVSRVLFWPALTALVALSLFPIGGMHPGWSAVLACVATLVVILRSHPLFEGKALRPLAWVGDISYSLYLVHWPIFALANNAWVGEVPLPVKFALIAVSFVAAWAQYTFIENPIRHAKVAFTWPLVGMAAACSLLVIALPYAAIAGGAAPQRWVEERRGNTGLGAQCVSRTSYALRPDCTTASPPTQLVWGDSYAMHLIPGIVATKGAQNVAQATKYVCGPLLDTAPVLETTGAQQNKWWAGGCLTYNREVIDFIAKTPSIQTVVLSSVFKQYMTEGETHLLVRTPEGDREVPSGVEPALEGIGRTIDAIHTLGRKVVVIAPPPAMDWDAGLCTERRLRGLPTFGSHADCAIPDAAYKAKRANVLRFLSAIPKRTGVEVIMFDPWLQQGDRYPVYPTGKIWYIANGHLSYTGSIDLAQKMKLGELILEKAR